MDDINCTGLLGLRRLLAARCSHEACCHPAAYPATFYWALPILQDHMSPDLPSMGRSIAFLLQCGMTADDIDLLGRVMPLAGDINSLNILKWFSPAHYLYLTARRNNFKIPNCVRFLHSHGLDLHALLDETHSKSLHYETFRGNTPTSLMMRYSTHFCLLRSILRDLNVDLDNFIKEELQRGPLVKAGWKQHTLQVLFKFEFVPFIMPVILCRICSDPKQVATEFSWLHTLERIKSSTPSGISASRISLERDAEIARGTDICTTICYHCHANQTTQAGLDAEEDDSVILFSF